MAIDRADWHWDDAEKSFRERTGKTGELTEEQQDVVWCYAADHIGVFLRWIINNGFESDDEELIEECRRVRGGELSGTDYLMSCCDGKFLEDDLCDDIVPFVNAYYSQYLRDYTELAGCYRQITGNKEYYRISSVIDKAYEDFTNK